MIYVGECALYLYRSWTSQVALVVKNAGWCKRLRDTSLIPGLGRPPGVGHGNLLQYSCLENPMNRGIWQAVVHRVTESQTRQRRLSTHACIGVHQGSQVALVVKNPPANAGDTEDMGSILGLRRSLGEGNGNPLQYSCLENPIGVWRATVHGVAKGRIQLSKFTFTFTP